jgi:NifB/MoaA-like Fe-S oxidoreductase
MQQVAGELARRSGCRIEVIPVVNGLFGETVTVSGLLGGEDVLAALQGRERGEMVFLPRAMFAQPPAGDGTRGGGLRTLDDLTIKHLQEQLGCPVVLADKVSEVGERILGAG